MTNSAYVMTNLACTCDTSAMTHYDTYYISFVIVFATLVLYIIIIITALVYIKERNNE